MRDGVKLSLFVGPALPVPAPRVVLEALSDLTVTTKDEGRSGFEMKFTLSKRSPLHTLFLIAQANPLPVLRVIVAVTLNGTQEVLMDGVVTQQKVGAGDNGQAQLVVRGEDLSALMDRLDLSGAPYPAMPNEARVAVALARYAALGVIPIVIPSPFIDMPNPIKGWDSHRGTDLAYITALARRVGYVFYLDPGPRVGMSKAYWGPRIKLGAPQPPLGIDLDGRTNVEQLSFDFDHSKNALPVVVHQDEDTGIAIEVPVPPITPLSPPLGLLPPVPTRRVKFSDELSKFSLPRALMLGMAHAADAADAVTGQGTLDVARYGRTLKARGLVGVRGAGPAFDGLHYVSSVTHNIRRGSYKQSFTLSRNGLLSTLPRLPT